MTKAGVDKDTEQLEFSLVAGGNADGSGHSVKQSTVSYKVKPTISI